MSAQAQRIDAVIFDLDDTLIDWSSPAVSWSDFVRPKTVAVYDYLSAAGHRLPPVEEFVAALDAAVRATWDEARKDWTIRSMEAVLAQVFVDLALEVGAIDLREVLRVYSWAPFPGVELFPDTIEVLRAIRGRGY
jgi:FMN phosphatase YigB (HAD superfamily)